MINIGGFGHTGNTALLDFISDSPNVFPVARNFGETAILRSSWGVSGAWKSLRGDTEVLDPKHLFQCLLGIEDSDHSRFDVPTINDFKRNARIRVNLGEDYKEAVSQLVNIYSELVVGERRCLDALQKFKRGINEFFSTVETIATRESNGPRAVALLRNDPAAYAFDLTDIYLCNFNVFIIRNPLDVAAEWIKFYGFEYDKDGAKKFVKQFLKKVSQFKWAYGNASPANRETCLTVTFEDLVLNSNLRDKVYDFLGVEYPSGVKKFAPEESRKNIGVHSALPRSIVEFVHQKCCSVYKDFYSEYCLTV